MAVEVRAVAVAEQQEDRSLVVPLTANRKRALAGVQHLTSLLPKWQASGLHLLVGDDSL